MYILVFVIFQVYFDQKNNVYQIIYYGRSDQQNLMCLKFEFVLCFNLLWCPSNFYLSFRCRCWKFQGANRYERKKFFFFFFKYRWLEKQECTRFLDLVEVIVLLTLMFCWCYFHHHLFCFCRNVSVQLLCCSIQIDSPMNFQL